mgnify:CR=1 FL=1
MTRAGGLTRSRRGRMPSARGSRFRRPSDMLQAPPSQDERRRQPRLPVAAIAADEALVDASLCAPHEFADDHDAPFWWPALAARPGGSARGCVAAGRYGRAQFRQSRARRFVVERRLSRGRRRRRLSAPTARRRSTRSRRHAKEVVVPRPPAGSAARARSRRRRAAGPTTRRAGAVRHPSPTRPGRPARARRRARRPQRSTATARARVRIAMPRRTGFASGRDDGRVPPVAGEDLVAVGEHGDFRRHSGARRRARSVNAELDARRAAADRHETHRAALRAPVTPAIVASRRST